MNRTTQRPLFPIAALGIVLTLLGTIQTAVGQAPERILYIRAEFNDRSIQGGPGGSDISDATWENRLNAINTPTEDYWTFNSYGNITHFETEITPVFQLPNALDASSPYQAGANPYAIRNDMVARAQNAGYNTSNYDTIVLSFPNGLNRLAGGALGVRNGNQGTIWLPGDNPAYTGLTHEYGHALGVGHANHFEGGSETYPGEHREGRDGLFMMGSEGGFGGDFVRPIRGRPDRAPINLPMRYRMGFFEEELVTRLDSNETVRLHAFDRESVAGDVAADRKLGAVFNHDNREWWVSFAPTLSDRWAGFNGSGWTDGIIVQELDNAVTRSLDFTPGSQGGTGNQEDWIDTRDGALRVGQSYTFPNSQLSLSPLQTGTTGGVPWIDVSIDFVPFAPLPEGAVLQADFQRNGGARLTEPGFVALEAPGIGASGETASATESTTGVGVTIGAIGAQALIAGRAGTDDDRGGSLPGITQENLHGDMIAIRGGDMSITLTGLEPGVPTTLTAFHNDANGTNSSFATVGAEVTPSIVSGATLIGDPEIGEHTNISRPGTNTYFGPYGDRLLVPSVIQFTPTGSTVELRLQSAAANGSFPVSGLTVTVIPEPTTIALLTISAVGLITRRRRITA